MNIHDLHSATIETLSPVDLALFVCGVAIGQCWSANRPEEAEAIMKDLEARRPGLGHKIRLTLTSTERESK